MKKIIYGKDLNSILDKFQEIKSNYTPSSISIVEDEVDLDIFSNLFNSLSMFGDNEIVVWKVSDKKYITEDHLKLIKEYNNKDFLLVCFVNLPKNSKILKYFTSLDKFEEKEKTKIFPLLGALTKKNKHLSVNLYYKMLQEGSDPIYINSMFFYQYKNILHGLTDSATYANLNPFVKRNVSSEINMYRLEESVNIINEIYSVDKKLKTTALDNELLVLNLLLKIVNSKVPA